MLLSVYFVGQVPHFICAQPVVRFAKARDKTLANNWSPLLPLERTTGLRLWGRLWRTSPVIPSFRGQAPHTGEFQTHSYLVCEYSIVNRFLSNSTRRSTEVSAVCRYLHGHALAQG